MPDRLKVKRTQEGLVVGHTGTFHLSDDEAVLVASRLLVRVRRTVGEIRAALRLAREERDADAREVRSA